MKKLTKISRSILAIASINMIIELMAAPLAVAANEPVVVSNLTQAKKTAPTSIQEIIELENKALDGDPQSAIDIFYYYDSLTCYGGFIESRLHWFNVIEKHKKWIEEKAAQGDSKAQYCMSVLSPFAEDGAASSPSKQIEWMTAAAESGLVFAQASLGTMYLKVETDKQFANISDDAIKTRSNLGITWIKKAAHAGDAYAQYMLGWAYEKGIGGFKSNSMAAEWYKKSADQGCSYPLATLAELYRHGTGVPKDGAMAAKLYNQAIARLDLETHKLELAIIYANGEGVPRDYVKAYHWANVTSSELLLGFGIKRNKEELMTELEKRMTPEQIIAAQTLSRDWAAQRASATSNRREFIQANKNKATSTEKVEVIEQLSKASEKKTTPTSIEIFSRVSPSVLKIYAVNNYGQTASQGSAVSIGGNLAVTNCHVIDDMDAVGTVVNDEIVRFAFGRRDKEKDLCLLKTDTHFPSITETRRFSDLKVGEKIYTIGSPKGLTNTFSEGIISGLRSNGRVKTIQITAPIAHGSSGGALVDEFGRLVGITSSGLEEGNLNFAVSIDEIYKLLR